MIIGSYIISPHLVTLSSLAAVGCTLWIGYMNRDKITRCYVFLKTGWEAHRDILCDLFGTIISFMFAYECFEAISTKNAPSIFYVFAVILYFFLKSLIKVLGLKVFKTNNDHIFDSKLEIARELHSHLIIIPPIFNVKKEQYLDFENRIRMLLRNHINYISKYFKPGFSWEEHSFSVSVLFYDHAKTEWLLFDTFYAENATRRSASNWPIKKDQFLFPSEMYLQKDDRSHNIIDIAKPEYESVLQIPLYFTNTRSSIYGHTKGNIYCVVCFASRKKSSFKDIHNNHAILRKYFLPEVYLMEEFLYKLYRIKVR